MGFPHECSSPLAGRQIFLAGFTCGFDISSDGFLAASGHIRQYFKTVPLAISSVYLRMAKCSLVLILWYSSQRVYNLFKGNLFMIYAGFGYIGLRLSDVKSDCERICAPFVACIIVLLRNEHFVTECFDA